MNQTVEQLESAKSEVIESLKQLSGLSEDSTYKMAIDVIDDQSVIIDALKRLLWGKINGLNEPSFYGMPAPEAMRKLREYDSLKEDALKWRSHNEATKGGREN